LQPPEALLLQQYCPIPPQLYWQVLPEFLSQNSPELQAPAQQDWPAAPQLALLATKMFWAWAWWMLSIMITTQHKVKIGRSMMTEWIVV